MNTSHLDEPGALTSQDTRDTRDTRGMAYPSSPAHATLDELKTDGARLSERVNDLNDIIDTLVKDIEDAGNKKFKCKEYPSDDSFATRTQAIVRSAKDVFKDLEVYTDRHLDYVQKHHRTRFFDKTQVLLMQMATSTDDTKYKVLIYSVINMVERVITLLNLFYDCSVEWVGNDHMKDEIKQNIYLFLDLIEHQASYIVTLGVFFKKYAVDGSLNKVTAWTSKAGTDGRREKMKLLHKKFSPQTKEGSVGCVIS